MGNNIVLLLIARKVNIVIKKTVKICQVDIDVRFKRFKLLCVRIYLFKFIKMNYEFYLFKGKYLNIFYRIALNNLLSTSNVSRETFYPQKKLKS